MVSFSDLDVEHHLNKERQLYKVSKLIDWSKISAILGNIHSDMGPHGYDSLPMFKSILLQAWHSLSDPGLVDSLEVRLDFLHFTGFSLGDKIPDDSTFCRFKSTLVTQGKYVLLLNEINRQLESHSLKVKEASVAIIDATIISSSNNPRKHVEITEEGESIVSYSKDPDASWKKKGNKSYFGYQAFARCDEEGFIEKTHVTPANKPECKELEYMVSDMKAGRRINSDKGFTSIENRAMLKSRGIKDGLMYKAVRNKPLCRRMKQFNRIVSKTRFRIEQCFGILKRRFGYSRASYSSTKKVCAEFTMKAICMNLLKAVNKLVAVM